MSSLVLSDTSSPESSCLALRTKERIASWNVMEFKDMLASLGDRSGFAMVVDLPEALVLSVPIRIT